MIKINIEEIYTSNGGEKLFKDKIWNDIKDTFTNKTIKLKKRETREIKEFVSEILNKKGWADEVKIFPSNISINYQKRDVGLCFQLGNVARIYSDLLKIQVMFDRKKISIGVIVVPMKLESISLGSNHAQYERLVEELKIFEKIINLPLVIIGIS